MQKQNKTFTEIHLTKTGKVSDKWASYLPFYDNLFEPLREHPVSIFEIGVQNGGSLESYAEYFKNAESFVGCDIDNKCAELRFSDTRIQFILGDANAPTTYNQVLQARKSFDIIIDDGSHTSSDILHSFLLYFPHLKPSGSFVIEDMHSLYSKQFGGGMDNATNAMNFFKMLTDVVNHEWWSTEMSIKEYLVKFFPYGIPQFLAEGWVDSIEFRNSIIVVKKALTPSHSKLGERLTRGNEFSVRQMNPEKLAHKSPI